jgi:hypothetical protein
VTEDDLQRIEAARERAMAQAREFFESRSPEQLEAMNASAQACDEATPPQIGREERGTLYVRNGWMPKSDYMEMEQIITAFQTGNRTADVDLETMLRILREATESIVRARVLAFLGELVKRDSLGPECLAQIETAIAPWREGPEDLDILYWGFVRRSLDARRGRV